MLGRGGDLPQIGDGDDGRAIPLPGRVTMRERAESLLAAGAYLYERPEWHPRAGQQVDLPFWLLGCPSGAPAVGERLNAPPPNSVVLREGGYCFLEALSDDGRSRQLIFDVGGLGYLPNAAHEHADALSILIRVNQTLVLADAGTGTYTGSASIRDGLRGTAAHNTVTIDDLDQADMLDTFKWVNPVHTELVGWSTSAHFDYAAATHNGYERLRRPVRHRREVLFVRPDYWIVVDRFAGHGRHQITRRFHFPPDVKVTRRTETTFDAVSRQTRDGLRFIFPCEPSTLRVDEALWSGSYGSWERADCLVAQTDAEPPLALVTFIVPLDGVGTTLDVRLSAGSGRERADVQPGMVRYCASVATGPARYEDTVVIHAAPPGNGQAVADGVGVVRHDAGGRVARQFGDLGAAQLGGNA
jgi:hypothetical protein